MLKYPLSVAEFNMLLKYQRYSCAICMNSVRGSIRGVRRAHVDHDHSTGNVRGILCRACNHGLGNFRDNIRLLSAAIVYLDDSKPLQEVFEIVDDYNVTPAKTDKRTKLLALAEEWGVKIDDLQKPKNDFNMESNTCSPTLSDMPNGEDEIQAVIPLRLTFSASRLRGMDLYSVASLRGSLRSP